MDSQMDLYETHTKNSFYDKILKSTQFKMATQLTDFNQNRNDNTVRFTNIDIKFHVIVPEESCLAKFILWIQHILWDLKILHEVIQVIYKVCQKKVITLSLQYHFSAQDHVAAVGDVNSAQPLILLDYVVMRQQISCLQTKSQAFKQIQQS